MAEEQEKDKVPQLTGLVRVLEILANKVSRKAALLGMAMILIYFVAVTPTVTNAIIIASMLIGIAVFGSILQWSIDRKNAKYRQEREMKEK